MNLLIVVTSTGSFPGRDLATGLWLSEMTHVYHRARLRGYGVCVASPRGGDTPVDPMSLRPLLSDDVSKRYWTRPSFRRVLREAAPLDDVRGELFDCIWLAGGHGAMFDFADDDALQELLVRHYLSGRVVAAVCHGVCGLLDVTLPGGGRLVEGRALTGYSRFEEVLVGRRKAIPYELETELCRRGAHYRKAFVPFAPKVVVDETLATGQNPFSSKQLAQTVMRMLDSREKAAVR